jgi:hypothetical protein
MMLGMAGAVVIGEVEEEEQAVRKISSKKPVLSTVEV